MKGVLLIAGAFLVGGSLVSLGGYLALSETREIQEAFADAEIRNATVVSTVSQRVEYIDGTGEMGRERSAEVHLVQVDLGDGSQYPTQLTTLVTASDVERLHEGDEVELAYLQRGHPVERLNERQSPLAVRYVLRSSVDASPLELVSWMRGRRWGAGANITLGIGVVILLFPFILLYALWRNRRNASAAPAGA